MAQGKPILTSKQGIVARRRLLASAAAVLPAIFARAPAAAPSERPPMPPRPERPGPRAFIQRAFAMRQKALADGDRGYGAIVVKQGRVVAQAPSRVILRGDPTAHAEMEAIRDAARRLGKDLTGCELYSSSPPCPMCEAAAYWAGIDNLYHGRHITDGGAPRLCW